MFESIFLLVMTSTLGAGPVRPPVDTLVVCPDGFRSALAPWVEFRAAQGHRLAFISPTGSSKQLRADLRALSPGKPPRFIVLVGDANGEPALPQARRASIDANRRGAKAVDVPTHYIDAKINLRWKSEPEIPSDNWYADWDGDQIPDAAIGRIPADSEAELSRMVERIIRYETAPTQGAWRRRVNFVAGMGGFGAWIDGILEAGAKQLVTDKLPAEYASSLTFASWQSAYCPDPRRFCDVTIDRFNEGCLFWVYIGHGNRRWVDFLRVPEHQPYRILTYQEVDRLRAGDCPPIACFFACYTAAFDGQQDCLGEEMLRQPGGPVAVIGGSRVTMPYGMAILGRELLQSCFHADEPTIGEALLSAKRRTMEPAEDDRDSRALLDSLAMLVSPPPADLTAERLEHLHLINLLGDPLMRIQRPQPVVVSALSVDALPISDATVDDAVTVGDGVNRGETHSNDDARDESRLRSHLAVRIASPIAGHCTIELVARRDRLPIAPPRRERFDFAGAALAKFDQTYRAANNLCWQRREREISQPGSLDVDLDAPAEATGPCHIRVFIAGEHQCAAGACDLSLPATKP